MKFLLKINTIEKKLIFTALILASLAALVGNPVQTMEYPNWDFQNINVYGKMVPAISVSQLANWIIEKRDDFLLFDSRTKEKFDEYHIPFALNDNNESVLSVNKKSKIVVYTQDESFSEELLSSIGNKYGADIYILFGGINEWINMILFPDLTRLKNTDLEQIERIKSTSRYFGGKPKEPLNNHSKRSGKYLREGC